LVRDDADSLHFDLSSIPVQTYEPSRPADAITRIRLAISDRLHERKLLHDLRVTALTDSMGQQELNIIRACRAMDTFSWPGVSLPAAVAMGLPRLLEKRVVRLAKPATATSPDIYTWTPLGRAVVNVVAA
ncbi:MAG: hypothetical protein ACREUQ_03670, partial [Burkholderiales bacterium]